jgi:hypothetical protein
LLPGQQTWNNSYIVFMAARHSSTVITAHGL